jgi:hypothetical protein
MKKILNLSLALAMLLSIVFIGEFNSSGKNAFSVQGQEMRTGQVTVRRKRRPGIIRSTGRGAKYVGRKTWQGTKWVGKKTWKGGRMVTSRAKKIIY